MDSLLWLEKESCDIRDIYAHWFPHHWEQVIKSHLLNTQVSVRCEAKKQLLYHAL
jgi:hypothetical protein